MIALHLVTAKQCCGVLYCIYPYIVDVIAGVAVGVVGDVAVCAVLVLVIAVTVNY